MKRRLKILFLASWYPSKENPNLGNFIQRHAELANEIADVSVLYAISSSKVKDISLSEEIINGVHTYIVYYPKVSSKVPILSSILKKNSYLDALETGFEKINIKFDLVHLNVVFPAGIFAFRLKQKYQIPFITTVHWTGFLNDGKVYKSLPIINRWWYAKILRNSTLNLPVSHDLGKSLQKLKLINNFEVFPNVVDSNVFNFSSSGEFHKTPRFLHISTFDNEHKNIDGMLQAFSKLTRNFELHIITENEIETVKDALKKHNISLDKCIIESNLPAEKVAEAMKEADCFVLFSWKETFSVVIAEALMSGLPIITSKCGGLTDQITKELGKTVTAGDIQALTNELSLFNSKKYDKTEIRNFAMQFSKENLKIQLSNIYQSMI